MGRGIARRGGTTRRPLIDPRARKSMERIYKASRQERKAAREEAEMMKRYDNHIAEMELYDVQSRRGTPQEAIEEAKKLAKLESEIRKRLAASGKTPARLTDFISRQIAMALREKLGEERIDGNQLSAILERTNSIIEFQLKNAQIQMAMKTNRQLFPQLIMEATEQAMKDTGLIQE